MSREPENDSSQATTNRSESLSFFNRQTRRTTANRISKPPRQLIRDQIRNRQRLNGNIVRGGQTILVADENRIMIRVPHQATTPSGQQTQNNNESSVTAQIRLNPQNQNDQALLTDIRQTFLQDGATPNQENSTQPENGQQESSRKFDCPICKDPLLNKDPIALTCGHVICLSCLIQTPLTNLKISCPVCRLESDLANLTLLYF